MTQATDDPVVGGRQRAHQSRAALDHQTGRFATGEQRDLRVPRLDRERRFELERVRAIGVAHDLLAGRGDAHPSALAFPIEQSLAELPEQRDRRRRVAAVERGLHLHVRLRGSAAHGGAFTARHDRARVLVELEGPEERGSIDVGQQARRALTERVGIERRATVGEVQGLAARERLPVEGTAGCDERGHVGDRVVHPEPGPLPLGMEGLVEVAAPGRVDGHELEVSRVEPSRVGRSGRQLRTTGRDGSGLGIDVGRERAGDVEIGAHAGEVVGQRGSRRRQPQRRGGHRPVTGPSPARHPRSGRRRRRATVAPSPVPSPSGSCASTNATASSMSSTTVTSSDHPKRAACRRTASTSSGSSRS